VAQHADALRKAWDDFGARLLASKQEYRVIEHMLGSLGLGKRLSQS
jgi:hypothetical protein